MAYTPINWATGDTITADKLNKMDNGWGMESTQLFSETVTTSGSGMYSATLAYSDTIDTDTVTVTFDGTEYECPRIDAFGSHFYGGFTEDGPVFTEYPFAIQSQNGTNTIYTETANTHTITAVAATMQTSTDFAAAVAVASSPELFVATENATTWQEVHDAVSAGKFAYVLDEDSGDVFCYPVVAVTHGSTYQVATLQKSGSDVTLRYYIADTADGPIYPN